MNKGKWIFSKKLFIQDCKLRNIDDEVINDCIGEHNWAHAIDGFPCDECIESDQLMVGPYFVSKDWCVQGMEE